MVAAGFTGARPRSSAADGLQALGRADGGDRGAPPPRDGGARIGEEAREQIVKSIVSFALYGFPSRTRPASPHRLRERVAEGAPPAAFLAGLLNAWPMGFYTRPRS